MHTSTMKYHMKSTFVIIYKLILNPRKNAEHMLIKTTADASRGLCPRPSISLFIISNSRLLCQGIRAIIIKNNNSSTDKTDKSTTIQYVRGSGRTHTHINRRPDNKSFIVCDAQNSFIPENCFYLFIGMNMKCGHKAAATHADQIIITH